MRAGYVIHRHVHRLFHGKPPPASLHCQVGAGERVGRPPVTTTPVEQTHG